MNPEDEAAWEAWCAVHGHDIPRYRREQRAAFLAGRVSGRADAAAQALEDAADDFDHAAHLYMEEIIRINDGLRLTGMHTIESARELVRHRLTEPAEELRARAAQYREKGQTQ